MYKGVAYFHNLTVYGTSKLVYVASYTKKMKLLFIFVSLLGVSLGDVRQQLLSLYHGTYHGDVCMMFTETATKIIAS